MSDVTAARLPDALVLDQISAGYGQGLVLQDVTLAVPASTVVALIGPNGAGKSTLLRTASGLLSAQTGSVRLGGVDVTKRSPSQRASQGLYHIPEGRGIFRNLSVKENLAMIAGSSDLARAIDLAEHAFPVLGQRLKQTAGTLSGGEQQMLALSGAYIRQARVILVDEPSLGLAPIIIDEVFDFLGRVRDDSGVSLLVVDQYPTRVLALAQQAYVLRRGKVVFQGEASTLLADNVFDHYIGASGGDATPADAASRDDHHRPVAQSRNGNDGKP